MYNRNGQFHSQTMEAHANDFLPLLTNAVQGGRSCITMVVDNGPDMNPTIYVNEYNLEIFGLIPKLICWWQRHMQQVSLHIT